MRALALLLLAGLVLRPFPEERELLDRRLDALRRMLPDGAQPAADVAHVNELAREGRFFGLSVEAQAPLEAGGRGRLLVRLRGTSRYADVERFFRAASSSPRLLDVESVDLSTAAGDLVAVDTLLALPFRPARAPLPPAPEGLKALLAGVPRNTAEAFSRDQAMAFAKTELIAALRRERRNPRLFLSELAAVVRERAVTLTQARLDERFVVRGLALGEGTVRALERRLERGFFRVEQVLISRRGACHAFEARGLSPVAGPDAELPLPTEEPFRAVERSCDADRDTTVLPASALPRKPEKGKAAETPSGALALRLRGVDAADAFQVLHRLTGRGFVVAGDVTGRVSLDLVRVEEAQVLEALARAGLAYREREALTLVTRAGAPLGDPPPAPPPSTAPEGEDAPPPTQATFSLKRAAARDVLGSLALLDPALATSGPPGPLARVSVWVREVPLAALRNAVLSVGGLAEVVDEGGQRSVAVPGAPSGELVPLVPGEPERRLGLGSDDVSVSEFELAGIAGGPSGWLALAYAPSGVLGVYRAGDRLADGSVRSVESTEVVLETEDGPVRVPLAAAAPQKR